MNGFRRVDARFAALLVALRVLVSAALHAVGARAVSDDDWARVVIAERFAERPRLDPSGTSWLPAPFWLHGAAMRLSGASFEVAQTTSTALAAALAVVLFYALRRAGLGPRRALAAGAAVVLVPPSAVLGAMIVPEWPVAVLGVAALALAATPGAEWVAAALVVPATLARYEAWPVALVVAVALLARRARPLGPRLAASALALAGPLAWLAWNRVAHGDALHFLARVAAYRAALGGPAATARVYLGALASGAAPPLFALAVAWLASHKLPSGSARPLRVPALATLALVGFLALGAAGGGAPTHHPERTLLLVWLLAAVALVDRAAATLRAGRRGAALACAAALAALVAYAGRGALDGLARRDDEEAIGHALAGLAAPGERALVATDDFGYFAVMAAFGRPRDAVPDVTHDPRSGPRAPSADDPRALAARVADEAISWVVAPARSPACPAPAARAGALVACRVRGEVRPSAP